VDYRIEAPCGLLIVLHTKLDAQGSLLCHLSIAQRTAIGSSSTPWDEHANASGEKKCATEDYECNVVLKHEKYAWGVMNPW
jgi:hypothetical protein